MKKIFSFVLLVFILFSFIGNNSVYSDIGVDTSNSIIYPEGEKFVKLKNIVNTYLSKNNSSYGRRYNGNLMYSEIIEKEIKAIVIETYIGNEKFYNDFFYNNRYDTGNFKDILNYIPSITSDYSIKNILFNERTAGDRLMNASFGIDYNIQSNDTLIRSLKKIIDNYEKTNDYYPTLRQLKAENIYNNGKLVKVSEIIDDIEYKLIEKGEIDDKNNKDKWFIDYTNFTNNMKGVINNTYTSLTTPVSDTLAKMILKDLPSIINSKSKAKMLRVDYTKKLNNLVIQDTNYQQDRRTINSLLSFINDLYFSESTYSLKRIVTEFTYEEALKNNSEIEKKVDGSTGKNYKDYASLIGDNEIKNIPEIYKKIPNDSIFLHVKDPKFIFELVNRKNTLLNSSSGVQVLKKLKTLSQDWFDIENFELIENNLTHEFIVVIGDLDLTNPDITVIINKKDTAILIPTEKPRVAVTKGDYIYIANSKKSLEKFDNLSEANSIYNSLDFKYLWLQKGEEFKDIFFFAGDNFFENMISFDYFIKMGRKIDDYVDLRDLQMYAWGYKIMNDKDITFSDLDNFFGVTNIDKNKIMNDFEISGNSIVKHNLIGTLDAVKGLSEIDYDLSTITSEELRAYQASILKYKEIWRANLDPMGIFINSSSDGYTIDFFMTPLPELDDNVFDLFKLFFGAGIDEFDFLKNEKLRIGTIGSMIGFEVDEIKNRLDNINDKSENRDLYYFKRSISEINDELLDGGDIFDYIGGEFMLSFGGIDSSILNGWDSDKLDAFVAMEFTSKIKAKEFISITRKKISSELGDSRRFDDGLKSALIKPISEEYNNETFYTIPLKSFYFPITFYYTIIDNFLYVTISEGSIKSIIDYSKEGGDNKQKFIDKGLDDEQIFYGFIDADKLTPIIKDFTSGTGSTIQDIYVEMMTNKSLGKLNPITLELSKYYKDAEYNKLMGKKQGDYSNDLGLLKIYSKEGVLYIKIDKQGAQTSNTDINEEINIIFGKIDEKYFSETGAELSILLNNKDLFQKLLKIDLFQKALNTDLLTNLLLDTSISLNIGDNIIEFKFASFGENYDNSGNKDNNISTTLKDLFSNNGDTEGNNNIAYLIMFILMVTVIFGGLIFIKKNNKNSSIIGNPEDKKQ